jgi:hypothetical protein
VEEGGGAFMNTVINVLFHKRTFCTKLSGCHLLKKMLAILEIKLLVACFYKLISFSKKKQNLRVTSLCDIQVKDGLADCPSSVWSGTFGWELRVCQEFCSNVSYLNILTHPPRTMKRVITTTDVDLEMTYVLLYCCFCHSEDGHLSGRNMSLVTIHS